MPSTFFHLEPFFLATCLRHDEKKSRFPLMSRAIYRRIDSTAQPSQKKSTGNVHTEWNRNHEDLQLFCRLSTCFFLFFLNFLEILSGFLLFLMVKVKRRDQREVLKYLLRICRKNLYQFCNASSRFEIRKKGYR